jgi:hypothetical protein
MTHINESNPGRKQIGFIGARHIQQLVDSSENPSRVIFKFGTDLGSVDHLRETGMGRTVRRLRSVCFAPDPRRPHHKYARTQ